MNAMHWLEVFFEQAEATPILEWIAIVAGITEVLLAKANKVLLYPAGIISTCIYTYLFIRPSTGLYADAILNVYYLVMSIYGWILWSKKKHGEHIQITTSGKRDVLRIVCFSLAGWAVLYYLLTGLFPWIFSTYVPSDLAVWDAFISAAAWVGMWLLAKRKIENWILLNISNIVAIPIYINKGMPFTAGLTLFLFIVAIFGYFEWKKLYKAQSAIA